MERAASQVVVNNEHLTVTKVSLRAGEVETLHFLGPTILVPMRGSACGWRSQSKLSSLRSDASHWLEAEEIEFVATSGLECHAYLVELKKTRLEQALALPNVTLDQRYESVDFENAYVRVIRFRLPSGEHWSMVEHGAGLTAPSVSIITSAASLTTRQSWRATTDNISWTAGRPGEVVRSGSTNVIKTSVSSLENVGDSLYEVVTLQLKTVAAPGPTR